MAAVLISVPTLIPTSTKCKPELQPLVTALSHIPRAHTPSPSLSPRSPYHPSFTSEDADITLCSVEGTLYRMHSFTLRNTSGLFRTMFSLPQPNPPPPDSYEIPVYEPSMTLTPLLLLLSGLPLPIHIYKSFSRLSSILDLAEKWDTPGPIEIIRSAITSPSFLSSYPLDIYIIASHFGWETEAKIASKHTLTLPILSSNEHQRILERTSRKHRTPLLELHRSRTDGFKILLDSPERFAAGNSSTAFHCTRCSDTLLDNSTWIALKAVIFREMELRPLGDTVVRKLDMAQWDEAEACWNARCVKDSCGGLNYDRVATIRQIRNCLDLVPETI